MPVDVSNLHRMLVDRLQEQISNPPGQQPADSQHVSQFQQALETGADAGANNGAKHVGATQPMGTGDGVIRAESPAMEHQTLTPGDRILAHMSSPSTNVIGEGVSNLAHTQTTLNEITLKSSIGVNSLSNTSQGFDSLLKSS